jgi:uncharacterized protein
MIQHEYFPLGIAKKSAFCNRNEERKRLKQNITTGRHSVIISPRRYGKSSLILYVLNELSILHERVDLFVAIDDKTIEQQILVGVKKLISKISGPQGQAINWIKEYLKNLKSKWTLSLTGISLELIPSEKSDSISNIKEALQLLEYLLAKKKEKAVLFIDEFQEIGVLANNKGIEGAIRHVAQETEYLVFIFSGSNRHILSGMVDDRSRPLYMLCDRINLGRIAKEYYLEYINKVAKLTWDSELNVAVFTEIFKFTEMHPYYINFLCGKLWLKSEKRPPKPREVELVWKDCVLQEETKIAKDLSALSTSQKKLLLMIASGIYTELSGKEAMVQLNLASATIVMALRQLVENDYIYRDDVGKYQILDPLLKTALLMFYNL